MPYSSISMESPAHVQDLGGNCEQPVSAALDLGGQCIFVGPDSVAVFDAEAAANLVCFKWFEHHNEILGRQGAPRAGPYPISARPKFADGRLGEVLCAADSSGGIEGKCGAPTTFAPEAEIPALLRRGALGALGWQMDSFREISTLRERVVGLRLTLNSLGHCVFRAACFERERSNSETAQLSRPPTLGGPSRRNARI